jgi:hypothetical protein
MGASDGPTEVSMPSERRDPTLVPEAEAFDDDITWPGLVERAMRAARSGMPDAAADRRLLDVVRGARASGFERALLAGTGAEACAYVMALLTASRPAATS